jgi:hypothetical protein
MNDIARNTEVDAAKPHRSLCVDLAGAADVDVNIHYDGRDICGEVTVVPAEDGNGYAPYGVQPDQWIASDLLAELRDAGLDTPAVLRELADAACAAAEEVSS